VYTPCCAKEGTIMARERKYREKKKYRKAIAIAKEVATRDIQMNPDFNIQFQI